MSVRTGNIERNVAESEHIGPAWTGDNVDAKKVAGYTWDSASSTWVRSGSAVTERYDYSSSTIIYTGQAAVGTDDNSTGWTITKYDLASSSAASGKIATDVSWTNKASGSYA